MHIFTQVHARKMCKLCSEYHEKCVNVKKSAPSTKQRRRRKRKRRKIISVLPMLGVFQDTFQNPFVRSVKEQIQEFFVRHFVSILQSAPTKKPNWIRGTTRVLKRIIALHYTYIPYYTLVYCTKLHYYTTLHITLHWTALDCTTLCNTLYHIIPQAIYYTTLHYSELHYTALHYIMLQRNAMLYTKLL